jgi:hypothetical protein
MEVRLQVKLFYPAVRPKPDDTDKHHQPETYTKDRQWRGMCFLVQVSADLKFIDVHLVKKNL